MHRFLLALLLLGPLGPLGATALASDVPEPHGSHAAGQPAGHEPQAGGHGEGGEGSGHGEGGGGGHGGAGGHHVYYTDDADGDGTPNWRDPDAPGDAYVVPALAFHVLNFSILLGILFYAVRRPVIDTFRERALNIRTELTETARRRDEAHQRHQELLARLEKIEGEVSTMEQAAVVDAKREEEKLIERAQREAERIIEQAERNIRDEAMRARIELRREAVDLAIQLAQTTLSDAVSKKDQQALAREFLKSVQGVERV